LETIFQSYGCALILAKNGLGYIFGRFFSQTHLGLMFTIFCDFPQFLAKKLAFFSKTNVMIKFLDNFLVKTPIFPPIFCENILKNHNIGPWSP
jgi:NADH:ubiquinone oxidoreductase subunit 4 (subunit M)